MHSIALFQLCFSLLAENINILKDLTTNNILVNILEEVNQENHSNKLDFIDYCFDTFLVKIQKYDYVSVFCLFDYFFENNEVFNIQYKEEKKCKKCNYNQETIQKIKTIDNYDSESIRIYFDNYVQEEIFYCINNCSKILDNKKNIIRYDPPTCTSRKSEIKLSKFI